MRLWLMEGPNSVCPGEGKRKPLQLLTGFFGRKSRRENQGRGGDHGDRGSRETLGWLTHDGDEEDSEGEQQLHIPEPREALHSPYHARTIDQDMEHLRLSRQDNPFLLELEVLESREYLYESSESLLYEEKHLMSKENLSRNPLTLSEVHARLVRSPPPVMWTRSRNSEPSFIHLIQGSGNGDSMFQFPPSHLQIPNNGHSQSDKGKIHSSSPGQYSDSHLMNGGKHRFMESAVEALSARFNLSPQPRRRPKEDHLLTTFMD